MDLKINGFTVIAFTVQINDCFLHTAWKVSKYGVFPGSYFPYSDWICRFTQ